MSRNRTAAVAAALGLTLLAGCGNGSNRPSLPSFTRPTITSVPTGIPTGVPTTTKPTTTTEPAKPTTTTEPAKPTKTTEPARTTAAAPTTRVNTAAPTTIVKSASATVSAEPTATSSSTNLWWLWIVLAVVLLAALIWFLVRRSRQGKWDGQFQSSLTEARWVATSVTDSLTTRTLSRDMTTVYWNESRPRVAKLQADLAALTASPPDDARTARVDRVRKSLNDLTQGLETHVALRSALPEPLPADPTFERSLAMVQERRRTLIDAIDDRPLPPPSPSPGAVPPPPPSGY